MVDGRGPQTRPHGVGVTVGSSAATDFTAGEMTLLRALIVGPPPLTAIPCPGSSAGTSAGSSPTYGLKDMMARVPMLTDRHGTTERLRFREEEGSPS